MSHRCPKNTAAARRLPHPVAPLALAAHLALAGMAAAAFWVAPAHAAEMATAFDIPSGALNTAIHRFVAQSGVFVAADGALTEGRSSPGLQGRHAAADALARLLSGTGLEAVRQAGGSFSLRNAPPPHPLPKTETAAPTKETVLPVVTVKAGVERETATGPVHGYVAKRSATATKTDTPIIETPQSISVQGRDELDDRGVNSLSEAARYVPGLQTEQYGGDPTGFTWFGLRGFADSYNFLYVDGLRAPGEGYALRRFDPFAVDRIEVLRGPASVLYGQGDAGGIVNIVSKRPSADAVQVIEVQAGNRHQSFGLDLGGAVNADDRLAWRIVGSYTEVEDEDRYPGYGHQPTRRSYVAPSLSWKLTPDTSMVLLGSLLEQKGPTNPFEYIGTDLKRTGVLAGNPRFDRHDQRQWEFGYQLEHRMSDRWAIKQNMRTSSTRVEMDALYGYNSDIDPVTGDIAQNAYAQQERMRYSALDTQLVGSFDTASIQHTLVTGFDVLTSRYSQVRFRDAGPGLNIFLPPLGQYTQGVSTPTTPWNDDESKGRQVGLYAQDQIRIDRWRLTLGGRLDRADNETQDHLENTRSSSKDKAFSGRVGANYMLPGGLVPYVSYAESFLPQIGRDASGNPFTPTRGKQYELGIKYQPADQSLLLTAAIFDLRKTNVPTTDPDNPDYQRQTGEIRSRGLELEAKAALTRQINLTGQFTYNDVSVTRSNDGNVGKHPINVPKLMASAWVDYAFADAAPGLSAGLGIRHVGKRYSDDLNTIATPGYTVFDAAVRYDTGPWRLALNVSNLLDKDYVATYAYGYYRGVPRMVTASLRYRF